MSGEDKSVFSRWMRKTNLNSSWIAFLASVEKIVSHNSSIKHRRNKEYYSDESK